MATSSIVVPVVWSVERSVRNERTFTGVVDDIVIEALVAAPVQTPQELNGFAGFNNPS